jgi:hypothetical protein
MKNLLESFAILLVGLLSIGVIYLIVQYNMIDDQNFIDPLDKTAYEMPSEDELEEDDDLDDDEDDIDADEDADLDIEE